MSRFLNFYPAGLQRDKSVAHGSVRSVSHRTSTKLSNIIATQSARIAHDFCGDWYSKTEFQHGIDLQNTSRFMAVALKKLQAELQQQREGHD